MKGISMVQEPDHWSRHVKETLLSITNSLALNKINIGGGAENGQFCYINVVEDDKDIECHSGKLNKGDILLEIQGQKVVGYILSDVHHWLHMICNNSIQFKSVHSDYLTKDLRTFLGTRFIRNSIDHDLQEVIRVNIYRRTVPCTTRPPKNKEVDGVDYKFVSWDDFDFLEKNGLLLESGIYEGNRYGTPKPLLQNMEPLSHRASPVRGLQKYKEPVLPDLPHGWDKFEMPEYGTYYIDHINKRTQFEHPADINNIKNIQSRFKDETDSSSTIGAYFTKNPEELMGTFVMTELIKSARGLGFTIVGGCDERCESFLQIKALAEEGPAALDGRLQPSDVLVYINGQTVLGKSREQVIQLFREIPIGGKVRIEICRGYPLPFDPDDPNNEIITTVAVSAIEPATTTSNAVISRNGQHEISRHTVCIERGSKGFGFTVVDGDRGQKVKEIRDKERCAGLYEGDKIEYVDGIDVRGFKHSEFVDLLKSKPSDHIVEFNLLRNNKYLRRNYRPDESSSIKPSSINKSIIENVSPNSLPYNESKLPHDPQNSTVNSSQSSPSLRITYKNTEPNSVSPSVYISSNQSTLEANLDSSEKFRHLDSGNTDSKLCYHELLSSGYYGEAYKPNYPDWSYTKYPIMNKLSYTELPNSDLDNKGIQFNSLSYREPYEVNGKDGGILNYQKLQGDYQDYKRSHNRSKTPGPVLMRTQPDPSDPGLLIESDKPIPQRFMYRYNQIERGKTFDMSTGKGDYMNGGTKKMFPPGSNRSFETQHYARKVSNLSPFGTSTSYYALPRLQQPPEDVLSSARKSLFSQDNVSLDGVSPAMQGHPIGGRPYGASFTQPRLTDVVSTYGRSNYEEFPVRLFRHANGFGFRIIGGVEENSQICVGHVLEGGAASMDGRLKTGDEIISIDGCRCLDVSHLSAVQMMGRSAQRGFVDLVIRRRVTAGDNNSGSCFDVELTRSNSEGYGFVILSSTARNGSVIGQLIEGSPAYRCGRLAVGDHILAINGVDVQRLQHTQVVQLVKDSGRSVTLTIASTNGILSRPQSIARGSPSPSLDNNDLNSKFIVELIQLIRGPRGFGFSIRGGLEFEMMPLFVLKIADGGAADLDGRLKVGDEICEINGRNTSHMSHVEAVKMIQDGGSQISLLIKRSKQNNQNYDSTERTAKDISAV